MRLGKRSRLLYTRLLVWSVREKLSLNLHLNWINWTSVTSGVVQHQPLGNVLLHTWLIFAQAAPGTGKSLKSSPLVRTWWAQAKHLAGDWEIPELNGHFGTFESEISKYLYNMNFSIYKCRIVQQAMFDYQRVCFICFHMASLCSAALQSIVDQHAPRTSRSTVTVFNRSIGLGIPRWKESIFRRAKLPRIKSLTTVPIAPQKKIRMRLAQVTRISRIEILEFKLNTSFAKYILHLCQHRQRHQSHQWEACQFSSAGWAVIKFVETLRSRLNPG